MEEKLNLCILTLNTLGSQKKSLDKESVKLIEILKRFRLEYFYFRKEFLSRWWSFICKKPMLCIMTRLGLYHGIQFTFFKLYALISDDDLTLSRKAFCLIILNYEVAWNWHKYIQLIYCNKLQIVNFKICGNLLYKELFSLKKKIGIIEYRTLLIRKDFRDHLVKPYNFTQDWSIKI